MGRIVRRDESTIEASLTETTEIQTEAASDPLEPTASDSSIDSPVQTTDVTSKTTQPTTPVETNSTPTTNSTPSSEPTTIEQKPTSYTEIPAETQQPVNNNDPSQTEDNTTQDYSAATISIDNTSPSSVATQASLAVTSLTLQTSVSLPIFPSSTIIQSVSAISPCTSSVSASSSVCASTSNSSSQSQLSGGVIAGIVIGAIAALAIICGCLIFRRRRQTSRSKIPPRHQSFLFTEEKPVFESDPRSDLTSNTSVYQSQNTFGAHQDSQITIPKYEYTATTISPQTNEFNKESDVATALYPPIKRNRSNEYMQNTNRMSVAVDTDNYTLSAMKLFQPPSRTMSPSSTIRDSQISNYNSSNNELASKKSIYRPSLRQSQIVSGLGHLRRESTIDPYSNSTRNKTLSLWDDSLKAEDDSNYSYNPNYEWTHDNGYIQPPLYRP